MKRLKDKVIVIAGGGGIGNALARRYALEGACVVIGDNHLDRGEANAKAIAAEGGEACAIRLDGTDEASIEAVVALAVARYGGLDGLHANFALLSVAREDSNAVDIPLEVYDRTMAVNARGFLLCTRHAVPAMIARGGGALVYTSSIAAHTGDAALVAYSMSKAAVHALMRHVARMWGPQGIRANAIAPGMVRTEAWDAIPPDYVKQMQSVGLAKAAIKSRVALPADIASVGTLLLSDEGAYITGQVISVDGGTTMLP